MPRLTKVCLRHYNWQIRCLCMGKGGGSACLPLHTLDYPCKPLYLLIYLCKHLYTLVYSYAARIPLYTPYTLGLYTLVYLCIPA